MTTCRLATFILLLGPAVVSAQRWVTVATGTTSLTYDSTTIERRPERVYALWTRRRLDKREPISNEKGARKYNSAIARILLDCVSGHFKVIGLVQYDDRQVVNSWEGEGLDKEWRSPMPETVGEGIFGMCKREALLDGSYSRARKAYGDSLTDAYNRRVASCTQPPVSAEVTCKRWTASVRRWAMLTRAQIEEHIYDEVWIDRFFRIKDPAIPVTP